MAKPLWIISYDISCPKRLRKVHKYCATFGWQMQKSLYLFAFSRSEREKACHQLTELINLQEDKLLCLPFNVLEGSFHHVPESPLILIHDDPRLEGFVY
ncbi:CRISPR-associated endonuclease Cas2 [Pseudoalteromonas sp. SG43-7]|uniref:CRISPR-associated endonuclease Cas2 n=1 Tax=Pseudoalteromonas sp. SG43-7 TaxID=2760966 RepID=UPI00160443D2|nr:CRISPR-associated endonuclease Cas2 [Pseudoalteromonas sp. SG43-7]MBB1420783.1 CRISPR-associated endonuclease Cas2 [Pseudoalteromonas sp. SG43-7]